MTPANQAATITTLASINSGYGAPNGGLTIDANGDLFGTTGGFLFGPNHMGQVYRVNTIPFKIAKTTSGYANTPTMLATPP